MASMAEIYIHAKRYDDALATSDEALTLDPNNIYALNMKGLAGALKYGWDAGLKYFVELNNQVPDFPIVLMLLGTCYARTGEVQKANEVLDNLRRIQQEKPGVFLSHYFAMIYLNLGDKEKFLEYYQKSIDRKLLIVLIFHNTAMMESVYHDERIRKMRSDLGLPNVN